MGLDKYATGNYGWTNGGMHDFDRDDTENKETIKYVKIKDYSNYKINFGKHKGRTFQDAKQNEKEYCEWLMKSTPSDFAKLFKDYLKN